MHAPSMFVRCGRRQAGAIARPNDRVTSLHRPFHPRSRRTTGCAIPYPVTRCIVRGLPDPRAEPSETSSGAASSLMHAGCLRCSCSNTRSRTPIVGLPFIRRSMEHRLPNRFGGARRLPSCPAPSGMASGTHRSEAPTRPRSTGRGGAMRSDWAPVGLACRPCHHPCPLVSRVLTAPSQADGSGAGSAAAARRCPTRTTVPGRCRSGQPRRPAPPR